MTTGQLASNFQMAIPLPALLLLYMYVHLQTVRSDEDDGQTRLPCQAFRSQPEKSMAIPQPAARPSLSFAAVLVVDSIHQATPRRLMTAHASLAR